MAPTSITTILRKKNKRTKKKEELFETYILAAPLQRIHSPYCK